MISIEILLKINSKQRTCSTWESENERIIRISATQVRTAGEKKGDSKNSTGRTKKVPEGRAPDTAPGQALEAPQRTEAGHTSWD